jgi:wobble nucleotide-excising tRNase
METTASVAGKQSMIESINIADVATYATAPQSMVGLSTINFVFGSNGSGKTTISRAIACSLGHERCTVSWKAGAPLKTLVYNRDFVETNFDASKELKGIFTLGEENVDSIAKLAAAKVAVETLTKRMIERTESLQGANGAGGFRGKLAALEKSFRETCWKQKVKHDGNFAMAFQGVRDAAEKFKTRLLNERETNKATLAPLEELLKRAETVFGDEPASETTVSAVSGVALLAFEANTVMKKRVMGKQDVDIAAMIKKLGNSDWVKQGLPFYDANDSVCPFCQQEIESSFATSLAEYFDESYLAETKAIDDLNEGYAAQAAAYTNGLRGILEKPSKFIDEPQLRAEVASLETRLQTNLQRLADKQREPSLSLELESISTSVEAIDRLIGAANNEISKRNALVANIKSEKTALSAQVWRHLIDVELKDDLAAYLKEKLSINKAIGSMEAEIKKSVDERRDKEAEIVQLEKASTSIQPTIDEINGLLAKFGFHGFRLARATTGEHYALNRGNGANAQHTLSEGERTFVTFLYFYHLIKGSNTDTGIMDNRIVVFDDPVSSLDSEILFIVASLVKSIFDEVRSGKSRIKQVFVLTHNAHFHKEVTFRRGINRKNPTGDETFWVVRKSGQASQVVQHTTNPIKTSYDLLWNEVRQPDRNNLSIQNTLRRILESYFKILGGVELHELPDRFDGADKVACASLVSWVNDGSHFTPDDISFALDQPAVDNYLRVFRAIFEKWDHSAHYRMMMGSAYIEDPIVQASEHDGTH